MKMPPALPHMRMREVKVQRSAKVGAPDLLNFVPAVDYHFFLNLPAALTKPGTSTLADLCRKSEYTW